MFHIALVGVVMWIGYALTQDFNWLFKFLVGCEIGALYCDGSMGILDIPFAIFIVFGGYLYGGVSIFVFISNLIKSKSHND